MSTEVSDEPDEVLFHVIDPYHAVAIVDITSAWARFEHEVDEVIWVLAGLEPEVGVCLTAQFPGIQGRFDALLSLARLQQIPSIRLSQVNALRSDVFKMAEQRNRVVHDAWFIGYKSKAHYRLQKTAKSKLDFSYKAVSEDDLKLIAVSIEELTGRFQGVAKSLVSDLYSERRPSSS